MIQIDRLQAAGVGTTALARAETLSGQAQVALARPAEIAWWVPGRIEVLGKHTDYAGGRVLNCATDLGLVVLAARNEVGRICVTSNGRRSEVAVGAQADTSSGADTYIATVVRRLARHFPPLTSGVDISIAANLPPAAGMSSSSAFITGLHLAIAGVNRLDDHPDYRASITSRDDLVQYLGCHENGAPFRHLSGDRGVGTAGGSQDHAAVVLSRTGMLNDWSFNPFHRLATVAWPTSLRLAVLVSGVAAEKTASAQAQFNRVSSRARGALMVWNQARGRTDPHLGAALAVAGGEALLAVQSDPDLHRRAAQFIAETQDIVPGAVAALGQGDLSRFATVVARSQQLAHSHLENQIVETITLVDVALQQGAIAASAFGAGFGGAVWAAFTAERADRGSQSWLTAYRARHPEHAGAASLHLIHPGPGCTALHGD
jgi:galactokinase